jgi:hypothetical protein
MAKGGLQGYLIDKRTADKFKICSNNIGCINYQ